MPAISFSKNIRSHVDLDRLELEGETILAVLQTVFKESPKLQSYLLDDDGSMRKHVAIFVNGEAINDRKTLSDSVAKSDEIFVMQALSGG